ncbi:MAG: lipopolysaccharide biosynthesis protein [Spirochaetaceae bacterium]|jgi:uncharacterized protein involved in exopolysaccharide biosynthesis|nr:lipopolysaccharide biosynthesis protein [Spirochaetaceae bacterium]
MQEFQENITEDKEFTLIDLIAIIWRRRIMITLIVSTAIIGVLTLSIVSLKLPEDKTPIANVYTPAALLIINSDSSSGIPSSLNSIASMAGISLSANKGTNVEFAAFLLGTNSFLDEIIKEFDLIARFKLEEQETKLTAARGIVKSKLASSYDKEAGVFTIAFTDKDKFFATDVVNFAVELLQQRFEALGMDKNKREKENLEINMANALEEIKNLQMRAQAQVNSSRMISFASIDNTRMEMELKAQREVYSQLKVQYELLKVTIASEKPVFQIIETASVPEVKSGPSRGLMCIIVTITAVLASLLITFALHFIESVRKDPKAIQKLRGAHEKK